MKIANWLDQSIKKLQHTGIDSARLDCLILLEDILGLDRVQVLTHPEKDISTSQLDDLDALLKRRVNREPLAYIRGYSEFYGRKFIVNHHVLIPRPESEQIIEITKSLILPNEPKIIDIGTGSGALAVTLALEIKGSKISAVDISTQALAIASLNAQNLRAEHVNFSASNLLSTVQTTYDVIVANLPYVSKTQNVSIETNFEPENSLYADDDGLSLIEMLINQIDQRSLSEAGFLILESEPRQHQRITAMAAKNDLSLISTNNFIQVFRRN